MEEEKGLILVIAEGPVKEQKPKKRKRKQAREVKLPGLKKEPVVSNVAEKRRYHKDASHQSIQDKHYSTTKVEDAEKKKQDLCDKRKERLKTLLIDHRDIRKLGTQCTQCRLFRVPHEKSDTWELKNDETFTGFKHNKSKAVVWCTACDACEKKRRLTGYVTNNSPVFVTGLANNLNRHLNGTLEKRREALEKIRKIAGGNCTACGIKVISAGKSGFRQESVTDINPKNRPIDEETPIHELVVVCLACQNFQNSLNWEDFKVALRTIATSVPEKNMIEPQFSQEEMEWIDNLKWNKKSCPIPVRLEVVKRDGRKCVYTGVDLQFSSAPAWNKASYDRLDSDQPYSLENTQLACLNINLTKKYAIDSNELNAWLTHLRNNRDNLFPQK